MWNTLISCCSFGSSTIVILHTLIEYTNGTLGVPLVPCFDKVVVLLEEYTRKQ